MFLKVKVQSQIDDYVGYTPSKHLKNGYQKATHFMRVLRSYVFSEPNIKSKPVALLSMNSPLCVNGYEGKFLCLDEGYVTADHCATINKFNEDYVQIALMFLGTPYLWGGRTSLGLDFIGEEISLTLTDTPLQKGDFVFWKGHVGVMVDAEHMVHANGTWMQVTIDPVLDFAQRVLDESGPVVSVRRFPD